MKLTRHNRRSGLNGVYNPRHNDRRFDVGNSEHIDKGRTRYNIYWDCYRGLTTVNNRENGNSSDFSFGQIEKAFYYKHYGDHVYAQNERNEKNRHPERNRSVEDLTSGKGCPGIKTDMSYFLRIHLLSQTIIWPKDAPENLREKARR